MMNQQELLAQTIQIRKGEQIPLREGTYWTEEDREILKREYYSGTSYNEIGIILQRSEGAIHQQVELMGLRTKSPASTRNRTGNTGAHKCLCKHCKCDKSECPRCKAYQSMMMEEANV